MTRARTRWRGAGIAGLLLLVAGFVALGVWQVERRAWKHALIAAVDARSTAAPIPAPAPQAWPRVTAAASAYSRVGITGRYLAGRDTRVQAVTARGSGYWVLTPLDTGRFVVLVNRGYVPQRTVPSPPPGGMVTVTGLLRITEPGGAFLRSNDPAADRWYSRDVAAIARARDLAPVAPYFIDADAAPVRSDRDPVGGLTVIRFSDNHAVYALTWFAMAALTLVALWRVTRGGRSGGE